MRSKQLLQVSTLRTFLGGEVGSVSVERLNTLERTAIVLFQNRLGQKHVCKGQEMF